MKARRRRASRSRPSPRDVASAVEYKAAFADMVEMAAGPRKKGIRAGCPSLGCRSNLSAKTNPLGAMPTELQAAEVADFIERYAAAMVAQVERFRRVSRPHIDRARKKKADRATSRTAPVAAGPPPPAAVDGVSPIAA